MKNFRKVSILSLGLVSSANLALADDQNKNILFIFCDDLRPTIGAYGDERANTPNIDKFAKSGVTFTRAYCNIAVSGASRASLLTGTRPTRNNLSDWNCRADVDRPDAVSMAEHFHNSGYATISLGKIYHHSDEAAAKYWDIDIVKFSPTAYANESNIAISPTNKSADGKVRGEFYEISEGAESLHSDYMIADMAISKIDSLKGTERPFILAVGFKKPHLPFVAPKKYWDLYDDVDFELPDNYVLKEGNDLPKVMLHKSSEMRHYSKIPASGPLDNATAKLAIKGYYAAVSFVDAQIGRVLDALESAGLNKNTTVVLIGDHGWNLGDNSLWCKHSVFNTSINTTMLARTPGGVKNHTSDQIVEFVDIYPTLCDATSSTKMPEQLEGESLLPLLKNKKAKSKGYAICRWYEGFTIVKDNYFYTEWWDKDDNVTDRVLFDHSVDPSESYNLANRPQYSEIVTALSKDLKNLRGKNFNEPAGSK